MAELTVTDIGKLREEKRGFSQTFDLTVNFIGLDLKKPENRIREQIKLPHKVRDPKVCFITDILSPVAEKSGQKVLSKNDLGLKPRKAKTLARDYDIFAVEAPLMPAAAKELGRYLGPRNKQMAPVPPALKDLGPLIEGYGKAVQINVIKSQTIQIPIGKDSLNDKQILENYNYAFEKIQAKLAEKKAQIKSVYLKTTMGKPMKVM